MKTGIITYHSTRNCGALLQAYALQNVVNNIGIENEILDYKCEKIEKAYLIKKLWELKSVKEFIKWIFTVNSQKRAQKNFDHFRKDNLRLSKVYDKNNISEANNYYDAFITGSDQVWNFNLNGKDENYILKFANNDKLKLSYAASMGYKEIPEEYIKIFKNNLGGFKGISLREIEAKENIDKLGYSADLVLDPTLLLLKEDYKKLINCDIQDKYIFVYTVANTPNIEKKAKELSKFTGYPIIWGHMSYKNKKGVKNLKDLSCSEFLSLINNAQYVLTSSFHGMALSIVFQKQFFYDLAQNKGNNNSRLTTLSELLELQKREIENDSDLLSAEPINYNRVNELLNIKKEESLNFLRLSLGK